MRSFVFFTVNINPVNIAFLSIVKHNPILTTLEQPLPETCLKTNRYFVT